MTDKQIRYFVSQKEFYHKSYQKNELILIDQLPPNTLMILLEGSITIARNTLSGNRVLYKEMDQPGDIIAELRLVRDYHPEDFYLVPLKDSNVLFLKIDFNTMANKEELLIHNILLKNLITTLSSKTLLSNEKMQIMLLPTVRKKILFYLLQRINHDHYVDLSVTREEWADYLNILRTSLSRELGRMNKEGLLLVKKNRITVLKPEIFDIYLYNDN